MVRWTPPLTNRPRIFRLSTWTPDITDQGFTFNQFLLTGEQPFLFHCGMRQLFPLVSQAIERVIPLEQLRWISLGHIEADECGAMNMLLASAPMPRSSMARWRACFR